MKQGPDLTPYLNGEKFSKNLTLDIEPRVLEGRRREDVIADIIRNRSVLHIGCTDHIPLIREKIESGKWLHKIITENSARCLGVDIDRQSVEYVRTEIGFSNVVAGDVTKDEIKEIYESSWDYVVFGEIIEHLDNPVGFLRDFRERYGNLVKQFIITVPNVFTAVNYRNMYKYREEINSDHRFWFSPYTILRILIAAGYNPQAITYAGMGPLGIRKLITRKLFRLAGQKYHYPFYYFKSIVVTGTL